MSRPLHSQHPPRTCRACCFSYPFRRRRRFSPAGSAADPAAADQQAARCRPTHAVGNPEAIASRFCRRDHGRGTRLCRRRSQLMGSARVLLGAWILAFRRGGGDIPASRFFRCSLQEWYKRSKDFFIAPLNHRSSLALQCQEHRQLGDAPARRAKYSATQSWSMRNHPRRLCLRPNHNIS